MPHPPDKRHVMRFKFGDRWRAEQLRIAAAGVAGNPVVFTNYPSGCAD